MKKPTNTTIFAAILLLVLIIGGLYVGISRFAVTSGLTIQSVDAPNVVSTSQDLTKLNWLILTVLGGGDSISFTMSPTDFESYFEAEGIDNTKTKNKFTATATGIDETLSYRINLQNDYELLNWQTTPVLDETVPCPTGEVVYNYRLDRIWPFSDPHFCVVGVFDGRYGKTSAPTTNFKAVLSISNGVQTFAKNISSQDSSVAFGSTSTIATATWDGSLVTGNSPPYVPEVAVISGTSGNRWKFITQEKLNSWQAAESSMEAIAIDKMNDGISSTGGLADMQAAMQRQTDALSIKRDATIESFSSLDSGFTLLNPTSTTTSGASQPQLTFTSNVKLTNPVVRWWIRADWLGVERNAGMPSNLVVTSDRFGNNQHGAINIKVSNTGSTDTFVATLNTCQKFTPTYSSNEFTATAGQQSIYQMYVDAGSQNSDLSETCSVCVYAKNLPTNKVCANVNLGFDATKVCTPNTFMIDNNGIYQCSADGLKKNLVTSCTGDTTATYTGKGTVGGYECVAPDGNGEVCPAGTTGTPPTCTPISDEGTFKVWAFVLALVIALIGGGMAYAYTPFVTGFKYSGWVRAGIVIVVAFGLFLLVPYLINVIGTWFKDLFSFGFSTVKVMP